MKKPLSFRQIRNRGHVPVMHYDDGWRTGYVRKVGRTLVHLVNSYPKHTKRLKFAEVKSKVRVMLDKSGRSRATDTAELKSLLA